MSVSYTFLQICRLLNLIVEQNKSTAKGRVLTQTDFQGALTRHQAVIKEGFLEKKNHNLYTTWTRYDSVYLFFPRELHVL